MVMVCDRETQYQNVIVRYDEQIYVWVWSRDTVSKYNCKMWGKNICMDVVTKIQQ
jgi:hypothetical protein